MTEQQREMLRRRRALTGTPAPVLTLVEGERSPEAADASPLESDEDVRKAS